MDYKKLVRNHEHQLLVNKWKEEQKIDYVQEFTLVKGIENNKDVNKLAIFLFGLFVGGVIEALILYFTNIYPNIATIFSSGEKDVLLAQYSITFLLVSFLAFLSENDDIILWVNVKQYLLINPRYINFVSITIWAFCTLFWSTIALFVNDPVGIWVFFVINVVLLVVLTLKMLTSYFEHDKLLEKIVKETFDKDGRECCFSKMYDNALVCIENKQVSVIYEMLDFLKDLRHKEFPEMRCEDKKEQKEKSMGLQNIKREYIKIVEACIEKLPDIVIRELYDTTFWSMGRSRAENIFERENLHYRFWQALRKEHRSKTGMYYFMHYLKLYLYKNQTWCDDICESISEHPDRLVNVADEYFLEERRPSYFWKWVKRNVQLPEIVREDLLTVVISQQWMLFYEMMQAIDITVVDEVSRQIEKLNEFMRKRIGELHKELRNGINLSESSEIQMKKDLELYEKICSELKAYNVEEYWNEIYVKQFAELYNVAKQNGMPEVFIEKIWNGRILKNSQNK